MKLSVWILMKWLHVFEPVLSVTEGEQTIEGIRSFSENNYPEQKYIYIESMDYFFTQANNEKILLIHKNDAIIIDSGDLEDVFNKVIEAFEYFSNWENQLFICAQKKHPEQEIINCCDKVLGPTFLMDNQLNIVAMSKSFNNCKVNDYWDNYLQLNYLPSALLKVLKDGMFLKVFGQQNDCTPFVEKTAFPYQYGVMNTYYDECNNQIGQLVTASINPTTKYEIHLLKSVKKAMSTIHKKHKAMHDRNIAESILKAIVTNDEISENQVGLLYVLQDWSMETSFYMICMQSNDKIYDKYMNMLKNRLRIYIEDCIITVYEDKLFCLVKKISDDKVLFRQMESIRNTYSFRFGISLSFNNLIHLPCFTKQSIDAVRYSNKNYYCFFYECALDIIMTANFDYGFYCCHPLINILYIYDQEYNTDFLQTLIIFLKQERNLKKTADLLYLHRNSIKNRISKIQELFSPNLENEYEREYLLCSYRIFSLNISKNYPLSNSMINSGILNTS